MTLARFVRPGFTAAAALALSMTGSPVTTAFAGQLVLDMPTCTTPSATVNGTTISVSCTAAAPPPSGAPTCSPSASPTNLPSTSGTVTLTANCSGTVTSYAWTRGSTGTAVGSTSSATDTPPASASSFTYGLQACNGNACATFSTSVVTIAAASGGGGGGGGGSASGGISCPGFNKTLVIDEPWQAGAGRQYTSSVGGFGANDALVVRFTVPAGLTSSSTGWFNLAEYGGGPVPRVATLSATACDFSRPWPYAQQGNTIMFDFMVGGTWPYNPVLQAGQTYYLNVKNAPGACPSNCDMFVDFQKAN